MVELASLRRALPPWWALSTEANRSQKKGAKYFLAVIQSYADE